MSMTVKELIETLQKQDPDAEIDVEGDGNYYHTGVTRVYDASFTNSADGKLCKRVRLSDIGMD